MYYFETLLKNLLAKTIPTNVKSNWKKLNRFLKKLYNSVTSIILLSSVEYCRKKNIIRYGIYVAFLIKIWYMAEIILIATSDIKGAGIGVETINVKLTLSNDNISMNISAMFIDQETSAS